MKLVMYLVAAAGILVLCDGSPVTAQAARGEGGQRQSRGAGRGAGPDSPGVSPGDVQKMFDAYSLMQAQEQLKISDDRFPQFLTRFKALQDVRRRGLQERARIVQDLRRLVNDPQGDEGQIKDRLKSLDDLEIKSWREYQPRHRHSSNGIEVTPDHHTQEV